MSTRSNCSSRDRRGERIGDGERVGRGERVGFDVDRAIGAAGQRLANHLRRARRAGRADDDLAAVLLLQPQRFLERVGVGLVQLEAGVLVADPGLLIVDAQLPLARDDLLDADGNFHELSVASYQFQLGHRVMRFDWQLVTGN